MRRPGGDFVPGPGEHTLLLTPHFPQHSSCDATNATSASLSPSCLQDRVNLLRASLCQALFWEPELSEQSE